MPTYLSSPQVDHEDYLAGGLYFFVIGRFRLELGDEGVAMLGWEVVVDSWFEPYQPSATMEWTGTHDRGRLVLTNSRGAEAIGWMKFAEDGAWLVVSTWEGAVNPGVQVFQRLGANA